MLTNESTKNELLTAIDEAVSQLTGLMSPLDENKVNSIPYNKVKPNFNLSLQI
jgi:hypothetical protein